MSSEAVSSIAATPLAAGPLRTVPRNRQVPPHSGVAAWAMRASTEIGSRLRYALMSSARHGGKERHLVPVADTGVQLHVLQVHGSERPLGQLAGAWNPPRHPRAAAAALARHRPKTRALPPPSE